MAADRLEILFQKYLADDYEPAEGEEFFALLKQPQNRERLYELSEKYPVQFNNSKLVDESIAAEILESILKLSNTIVAEAAISLQSSEPSGSKMHFIRKWYWAAAVAIIIGISLGTYFLIQNKNSKSTETIVLKSDVAPGGIKAILTLSNGSQIILDSAQRGMLAKQGNTIIIKTDSGKLDYSSTNSPNGVGGKGVSSNNTLSTPRGGQYQLILPDGTKVWLNAASSITYPTAFTGKARNVSITGEVYFEVKHDASKPFTVAVNGIEVHDIGTSFNINAYSDEESIKTTLLEGSVKVSLAAGKLLPGNQNRGAANGWAGGSILRPGEQAIINDNKIIINNNADLKKVMAWKEGLFRFDGDDLPTVMRSVSRWYDVNVVYDLKPTGHFTGVISRNVNASEVFNMLELTGAVHFKIKDKTVTVVK